MDQIVDLCRLLPISKEIKPKLLKLQRECPPGCIVGKPVTKEMVDAAMKVVNDMFGHIILVDPNGFWKAFSNLNKGKRGTQSVKGRRSKGKRSKGKRSKGKRSKGKRSKGKRSKGKKTHKRSQYGGVGTPPRALARTVALSRYTSNQILFSRVVFGVTMVFIALWVFNEIPLSSRLNLSSTKYNSLYQLLLSMGLFSSPVCEETEPSARFVESHMRDGPHCTVSSRNVTMTVLPLLATGGCAVYALISFLSKRYKIPIMSAPFSIGHSFDDAGRAFDIGTLMVAEIFIQTENGRPTVCEEYPEDTSDESTLGELLKSMYRSLPNIREIQANADDVRATRATKKTTMINSAKNVMSKFKREGGD
jgi:hypothetical protein